jgi:hypothetical protein
MHLCSVTIRKCLSFKDVKKYVKSSMGHLYYKLNMYSLEKMTRKTQEVFDFVFELVFQMKRCHDSACARRTRCGSLSKTYFAHCP